MNPTTRMPSRSLPSPSKKMIPGGPNRPKRLSSALCASLLAVTSALSSSIWPMRSATRASLKVKRSISLHDTHQSA